MRHSLAIRASGPLIGVLMMAIDGVGIVVVLPTIQADLDTSFATLQWVLSAYLLAVAATVILVGRLGDIYGRRRVFVATMVLFAVGSLICGLAPSDLVLLGGRIVQGAGGAGLYVLSLSLVTAAVPREKISGAIALWATMAGVGMAVGPIAYGALIDLVDWRAVFLFNIPVVALGILLTFAFLEESSDSEAERRIDVLGIGLITTGLLMLMIGIIQADAWGWGSPLTLGLITASLIPFAAFWRVESTARAPLMELDIFAKNLRFVGANVAMFGLFFTLYAFAFVVAIFLQDIQGHSASAAALRMLPWPIAFVITSHYVGQVVKRVGPMPPTIVGGGAFAASVALLSFADADTSDLVMAGIFALFGASQAVAAISIIAAILGSVPPTKLGAASGIRATVSYVSGSLGVAIVGAVLLARERTRLGEISAQDGRALTRDEQREIDGILAGSDEARANLDSFGPLESAQIIEAAGEAFTAGLQTAMLLCAGLVVICIGVMLALTRRAEHREPGPIRHPGLIPFRRSDHEPRPTASGEGGPGS